MTRRSAWPKRPSGSGWPIASSTIIATIGTPLGTAIAAPVPQTRELMCRDGLKYYARIPGKNIRAAQDEVEAQRAVLHRSRPRTRAGEILAVELDMAARMAVESCRIMLWQQAVVGGRAARAPADGQQAGFAHWRVGPRFPGRLAVAEQRHDREMLGVPALAHRGLSPRHPCTFRPRRRGCRRETVH